MPEPGATTLARYRDQVTGALGGVPASADGRTVWRALGHAGVLAGLYPQPGGRPDPARLGLLLGELDARYPIGPVLSVCTQAAAALPVLGEGYAQDVPRKVYAAAIGGDVVLALAATDAGAAGSDLLGATTTARPSPSGVAVDGAKQWITNACTADYFLVLGRHRPAQHFTSFLWVLVPAGVPGIRATPASESFFAGSGVGHLHFDKVVVPAGHLVGSPGRAMASFTRHIGTERLASALWARALCRRVLTDMHGWLRERTIHGGPAWENDAIRQRFARCLVELRRLDASCAQCAQSFEGPDAMLAGLLVKVSAAETLQFVLGECVQLRGSDAFGSSGLAHLSAEAAMWGVAGGATGAMLSGLASHAAELLREPEACAYRRAPG